MPKVRLGVALLIPPAVAAEVDGLRRALEDGVLGRVPAHLTLVPPVNVRADRMSDALAVLREAAASVGPAPITLTLGPPATFLPDAPVLHLAVGGDLDRLRSLRDAVFAEPLARPLTWPWVPHVTLADEADPARIGAALVALSGYRVEVAFERAHLLQQGPGRVWAPIADAPFGPPAVVGRGGLALELTRSEVVDPETAGSLPGTAPPGVALLGSEVGRPFVVTARRDAAPVGAVTGSTGGAAAVLTCVVVASEHRGQGIGSHLLAAAASEAAARGCTELTAGREVTEAAGGFLRHRGWGPAPAPPGFSRPL
ncbi:MAG: GNAT family N-acetyltransferase [Acidimicrobiales bacterium]